MTAECSLETHLFINIAIIVGCGGFGGYLNFLHNFDTVEREPNDSRAKIKFILLGVGAAILVPAFLKMISSNLASSVDNNDHLIFAGFCLVAAIFSRRFITTIGEKILEAAKRAERTSQENKQNIESTKNELTTTKERIADVKLAIDLKNSIEAPITPSSEQKETLLEIVRSYLNNTSIPDYSKRVRMKAALGRKMGELILRNNFSKKDLLNENKTEGMLLAIAYAIQLRPEKENLNLLNEIAGIASQLYTKYSILTAYDTLATNNFIDRSKLAELSIIINGFRVGADSSLLRKIEDTLYILNITIL